MSDRTEDFKRHSDCTEKDVDFLKWIWMRLTNVKGDWYSDTFMVRLGNLIDDMEEQQEDVSERQEEDKPPLGLRPRVIAKRERSAEILCAIGRYNQAGKYIPAEWLTELEEMLP